MRWNVGEALRAGAGEVPVGNVLRIPSGSPKKIARAALGRARNRQAAPIWSSGSRGVLEEEAEEESKKPRHAIGM